MAEDSDKVSRFLPSVWILYYFVGYKLFLLITHTSDIDTLLETTCWALNREVFFLPNFLNFISYLMILITGTGKTWKALTHFANAMAHSISTL